MLPKFLKNNFFSSASMNEAPAYSVLLIVNYVTECNWNIGTKRRTIWRSVRSPLGSQWMGRENMSAIECNDFILQSRHDNTQVRMSLIHECLSSKVFDLMVVKE